MTFEELFYGISFRHAENSERDVSGCVLERVITSPEPEAERAVYVAVRTEIEDTSRGMRAAYANGCRVFVCRNAAFAAKGATVLLTDSPEQLLGELAARMYGYPAREMTVIGVTGSAGKTSVVLMLSQLLRRAGVAVASLTTDGLLLGKRFEAHGAKVPDAAQIQGMLRRMRDAGTEVAIFELSAYQLRHFAANGIDFTALLLTNLFAEGEGTVARTAFEAARAAKQQLLSMPAAVAVLPTQCALETGAKRVIRFGEGGELCAAQKEFFYAVGIGIGTRFMLCAEGESAAVTLPLAGACAVENALCAAALARVVGMSLSAIAEGLSHVRTFGRMECVAAQEGRMVYIDSAYTPQALQRALQYLRSITEHRLCVLLGSVGGRASKRRAPLGRVACELADYVYLTADDPDTEDPRQICEEMLAGMAEKERVCILPDRHRAIARAIREMRQGDVLLLAGKGADAFQLVGGVRLPFCEAEIVKAVLAEP